MSDNIDENYAEVLNMFSDAVKNEPFDDSEEMCNDLQFSDRIKQEAELNIDCVDIKEEETDENNDRVVDNNQPSKRRKTVGSSIMNTEDVCNICHTAFADTESLTLHFHTHEKEQPAFSNSQDGSKCFALVTTQTSMETSLPTPLQPERDFIITLESLPILWDRSHKDYVNKHKRNEALEKLLIVHKRVKPQATIEDVKKRINILRSNYRRELKKIIQSQRPGAGADEVYIPRSWSFKYLRFLDNVDKPQVPDKEDKNNSDGIKIEPHAQQGTESQGSSSSKNTGSISSVNAVPPPPHLTKIKKGVVAKQNELLDLACAYLSESKTNRSNSIAFEWANTLDRLDPTQRLYAKKAINDILFEAELGTLNRYSVEINTPVPSTSYSHTPVTSPYYSQSPVTSPYYSHSPVKSPLSSSNYSSLTSKSQLIIGPSSSAQSVANDPQDSEFTCAAGSLLNLKHE